jgi:Uma2 family endonuclease
VIFTEIDAVEPDFVWLSHERLAQIEDATDDHLHGAPELVVEVLSQGAANERRDRERKLALYSRYGVEEYWLLDPRAYRVEVYRRTPGARRGARLRRVALLGRDDTLTSPLLPGFAVPVARLFRKAPVHHDVLGGPPPHARASGAELRHERAP